MGCIGGRQWMMLAILLSTLTGLFFEVYQGYSKHHSGYSHIDMLYNSLGVLSASVLHMSIIC